MAVSVRAGTEYPAGQRRSPVGGVQLSGYTKSKRNAQEYARIVEAQEIEPPAIDILKMNLLIRRMRSIPDSESERIWNSEP